MKTIPLNIIFEVTYGNKLDLNKMLVASASDPEPINFVSRTEKNNGVAARVKKLPGVVPYDQGCITVALGGAILSSFVQTRPFYTAQNVAVLKPINKLATPQLLYYCLAIEHNKFRYGAFGREANRTLKDLLVPNPASLPFWVNAAKLHKIDNLRKPLTDAAPPLLGINHWHEFKIGGQTGLFIIKKGKRLTKNNMKPGHTPFVGSSDSKNGITSYIAEPAIHKGNTITVCYNGSVAEAFYQPKPFWATDDVNVLYPKFDMNAYMAMFLITILRQEKFRFNYGRKWHMGRMAASTIRLPVDSAGSPDWAFMETYIKSLPYSSAVRGQL